MKKSFDGIVIFARTGLNPRTNFKLGKGTNKYITNKNIHNNTIFIDDNTDVVDDDAIKLIHKRSQIKKGDVLFCSIGRMGDMYIIQDEPIGWDINESVFAFTLNTDLIRQKYFYYVFKHHKTIEFLSKNSSGSTFKSIKMNQLKRMTFDVPTLEEQDNKITVLDNVCKTIKLRKQQIQQLDELVKARFVELFGDRYTNDKKWDNKPLYECADFYNGKAHEQVVDENGEYILVTSRCIASDISDYRRTNALLFPLQVNDIAMVMSDVPNGRALAKCVLIDEDGKYTLNQRICCLRNYSFNPIFFYYLLNRHEYFLSFNDGNAQTNLRKDDLLACNIIIPPMEVQEQFADFVAQIDKSKSVGAICIDKIQSIKGGLL